MQLDQVKLNPELPISERADEIVAAIRDHQTVIVAGATGSGKSTQLPKLCLMAGRGAESRIGVTQPRRIAARSIASRLASELGCDVGGLVGYKMRFAESTSDATRIKVMTDGTLLAELASDREWRQYDTIIIDEAHERSLNIDFLLGYLHRIRARRPDLKIVITSATIDTQRLAKHFDDAPVIDVEGRSFPVDIRYRPPEQDEEVRSRRASLSIRAAIDELGRVDARGDILVFLSGEREIHEVARDLIRSGLPEGQVLPLYSRLPRARQDRIFKPGGGRRVILATNIAETSLTIPGIRFVIDLGTARLSRYSHRSKIQRLLVEPISQASANQRAGRCGRTSDGICIRLFDETDFESRPAYTEPELLRSDLAGVVLQMKSLQLGDPLDFPFVEMPPPALVRDGHRTLQDLGALLDNELTTLGRKMVRLPVDVRVARMLIESQTLGCVSAVVTIASMLSLQDPRERPADAQQAADQAQSEFNHPRSDFLTLLRLWDAYDAARQEGTRKQLNEWCRKRFINVARMREWGELRRQLFRSLDHRDVAENEGDHLIHRALLPALVTNVGRKDENRRYESSRGRGYQLFPGSVLFEKSPPWIMCAFVVETAKVYGRLAAPVEPSWIEVAAPHLIKVHYGEPFWSRRQGRVMAKRHANLFGLALPNPRSVGFANVDPLKAREVFIADALVDGQLRTRKDFLQANTNTVAEVRDMEAKLRSSSLLVGEDAMADYYASRIPDTIVSAKALERWLDREGSQQVDQLKWRVDDLVSREVAGLKQQFPETMAVAGIRVPVSYVFDRRATDDGATLTVPVGLLDAVDAAELEWLVPGWLPDKIVAMIRTLPKAVRRALQPASEVAQQVAKKQPPTGPFFGRIASQLSDIAGLDISSQSWDELELPSELRFNLRVVDERRTVAEGRDVHALRKQLGIQASVGFLQKAGASHQLDGLRRWSFGDLSESVKLPSGEPGWRAVVDQRTAVGVRVFADSGKAARWHAEGVRRLLLLQFNSKVRSIRKQPPVDLKTLLYYSPVGDRAALVSDLLDAAAQSIVVDNLPWDKASFVELTELARRELLSRVNEYASLLETLMSLHHETASALDNQEDRFPEAVADQRSQLGYLIYPGFLVDVPRDRLAHFQRYLRAALQRAQQRPMDPSKDASRQRQVEPHWRKLLGQYAEEQESAALTEFHWLLEEWRVSLFAQALGTIEPVSARRISQAWKSRLDA